MCCLLIGVCGSLFTYICIAIVCVRVCCLLFVVGVVLLFVSSFLASCFVFRDSCFSLRVARVVFLFFLFVCLLFLDSSSV